jgi:hypothetical protein
MATAMVYDGGQSLLVNPKSNNITENTNGCLMKIYRSLNIMFATRNFDIC